MKLLFVISSLFAVSLASLSPLRGQQACLKEKEVCSGFAGPIGECCDGLVCVAPPGVADRDVSVLLLCLYFISYYMYSFSG